MKRTTNPPSELKRTTTPPLGVKRTKAPPGKKRMVEFFDRNKARRCGEVVTDGSDYLVVILAMGDKVDFLKTKVVKEVICDERDYPDFYGLFSTGRFSKSGEVPVLQNRDQ